MGSIRIVSALLAVSLISGCGLELFAGNVGRDEFARPASVIKGKVLFPKVAKLEVTDADGAVLEPFEKHRDGASYEFRLPSAQYSMLYVKAVAGNMTYRAIVPEIAEESEVRGVNVDAESVTEAIIVEARLSADGARLKQLTPGPYVATRTLIRKAMKEAGPTKDLLAMVERLLTEGGDPASGGTPVVLGQPELDATFAVTLSPIDSGWQSRNVFDYDGDGARNIDTSVFDAKLAEVAQLFRPAGCPDAKRIRIVFAVNFNDGQKNGNCGNIDRFKWATDKPGKQMFFVGWLHMDSPVQDPLVAASLGGGVPNQVTMYDDGTNGDEAAGDNIWTVFFDVPRGSRIGYKYTWGFKGSVWTGTEEWPGNSHIIEAVDVNGDDLVYRMDNFGDEATNKDASNLNAQGNGTIDWTTDLNGDGIPEAQENMADPDNNCTPDGWFVPTAVGPLTVACTDSK